MENKKKNAIRIAAFILIVAVAAALGFYASAIAVRLQGDASAGKISDSTVPAKPAPSKNPHNMMLQAQYPGPLKDTVIQRWRDSSAGTTCYIYLPIVVRHSAPTPTGFVEYSSNGIGSISCLTSR